MRWSQWWEFIVWFESRHHVVWYIHGNERFGGTLWVCLHRPSDDCSSRSSPNRLCWPFRLHGPITEKTAISNLHIIHFSRIVSLCYKNLHTHVRQYIAPLFYIILWYEQKCVTGNIMKNSKVYCLINVCIQFCNNFEGLYFLVYFLVPPWIQREWDYGMAVGCFTDVMVHSSKNYQQEHVTEPRWLQETPLWPLGAL